MQRFDEDRERREALRHENDGKLAAMTREYNLAIEQQNEKRDEALRERMEVRAMHLSRGRTSLPPGSARERSGQRARTRLARVPGSAWHEPSTSPAGYWKAAPISSALKGEPVARETAFKTVVTILSWPRKASSAP